jgi:hypothetical protein
MKDGLLLLPLLSPRTSTPGARIESAFTAIRIEGGLFPAEFLQRIAAEKAPGQSAVDYGIPPGRTLRDEIGRYWTIAEALWREYRRDQHRADLDPRRVGVERWLLRLLRDVFGYVDLTVVRGGASVGERGFPITHRVHDGKVALLLTVAGHDLDRAHVNFGDEGRRRAPHAAMQEYLNAEPSALWGVVSNGLKLRLLRDNPSLTRPAYIEADLERIFEEGLYPDFAALWLIAHASRMAPGAEGMSACWLEKWRAVGAETGQRALAELRAGVTQALRELGSGFVEHPSNDALRNALNDGTLTAEGLHQQLLRLVYRLLFLFTAEERGLLHAPEATPQARALYAEGYGLARLRDRARRKRHYDAHADLWTGLTVTFRALARGAPPLGLPALGGLFEEDHCDRLDAAALPNRRLLAAIHALAFFTDKGALQRVNYRDMGTEELGSVYESLLELHPVVQVATQPWTFAFVGDEAGGTVKGSERKLSGSYYTPDSLVQELLRTALDPVIERAIRDNPADPRGALLRLRVLDPACGSGHFLLGAARRLADAVARLDMEGDLPDETVRRRSLREVVRRCIFGVDRNPLSVELCKTALWIEAIEPGRPLSFLDAHIKCGDSLIGVADLSVLKTGIPDEAFRELTGDDKGYCRDLKKRNKGERENPTLTLLPEVSLPADLAAAMSALTEAPEDTADAVRAKRRALEDAQSGRAAHDLRVACDLWCAAFFASKAERAEMRGRDMIPTTDTVWRYMRAPSSIWPPLVGAVEEMRGRLRFFHWPLEFPEAFSAGGFDCVLGNPPWEVLQLSEEEYFAARSPSIAALPGARRKAAIKALESAEPAMWSAYRQDLRLVEATNQFIRESGFYELTARGKLNTYALFAETFLRLPGARGRAGFIVPTGIATDDGNKLFFDEITESQRLASLHDFENREGLFPEVHRSYKFTLLTLGNREFAAQFVFFAARVEHLLDERRAFALSAEDIRLINPNTRTTPVFRSSTDAELTKRIYARVPVLVDEARGAAGNPWRVSFRQGLFNMTADSALFRTAAELAEAGAERLGAGWVLPNGTRLVPLYEAKMLDQFDHRYADYSGRGNDRGHRVLPEVGEAEHRDPNRLAVPFYWVSQRDVEAAFTGWTMKPFFLGYGEATTASTFRTLVMTAIPKVGVGHKTVLINLDASSQHWACFYANANSIILDYFCRQKVSYLTLGQFIFKQLPFLRPEVYTENICAFIVPRVLELAYTANDMRPWAEDLGYSGVPFVWDQSRRAHLRAELDAAYARLYDLTRDELRYVLDPADIYGADFPSETFRIMKEKERKEFGEYLTARLVLAAWDRLTADGTFASWGR